MILLDSVTVAGFLDATDPFHVAADQMVRRFAGSEQLVASAVTLAELLTGAGLGHHATQEVRAFFADLITDVVPVDATVAERGAELRVSKKSLKLPDALILATAEIIGASLVVTGDEQWSSVPGYACQVEVIEPTSLDG